MKVGMAAVDPSLSIIGLGDELGVVVHTSGTSVGTAVGDAEKSSRSLRTIGVGVGLEVAQRGLGRISR